MTIGSRKVRGAVAGTGDVYASMVDRKAPLADFIENPAKARESGKLPLAPPTRSGRAWEP